MIKLRTRIFRIIDAHDNESALSKGYNILNISLVLVSLVPLLFKEQTPTLRNLDQIALTFFLIEYILHLLTADIKYSDRPKIKAFYSYPFSFYGIVDLLSILPMLRFVGAPFRLFRLFRLFQSLRIFRVFKIFRYSDSVGILINAIKRQKDPLQFVFWAAFLYLIISSILMFNIEPESFPTYFDALFWSAGALTTATFGDNYPQTPIGQIIGIISFLLGVLIVALPSSIITVGFLDELKDNTEIEEEIEELK